MYLPRILASVLYQVILKWTFLPSNGFGILSEMHLSWDSNSFFIMGGIKWEWERVKQKDDDNYNDISWGVTLLSALIYYRMWVLRMAPNMPMAKKRNFATKNKQTNKQTIKQKLKRTKWDKMIKPRSNIYIFVFALCSKLFLLPF